MKTAVLCLLVVSASTAVSATTVNYNGISLSDIGPFLAACRANQQGRTQERFLKQGCQMAKFDPFLSLDCARVEGKGAQRKQRKGSNFAAQRSGAIVQKPEGPNQRADRTQLLIVNT